MKNCLGNCSLFILSTEYNPMTAHTKNNLSCSDNTVFEALNMFEALIETLLFQIILCKTES